MTMMCITGKNVRRMKRKGIALDKVIVFVAMLMAFAACTQDELSVRRVPLTLMPYTPAPVTVETRALPSGYVPFTELHPQPQSPQSQIGIYLVDVTGGNKVDPMGTFTYVDQPGGKTGWVSTIGVIPGRTYNVFGFHPAVGVANNSSLDYSTPGTPVLHLPTLSAVTELDVCVAVGVAKGEVTTAGDPPVTTITPIENSNITLGKFDYLATAEGNYIYLLVDHLFSCVEFNFKIDATYQELRDIVVRKVEVSSNAAETVDITVTLHPNTSASNPIINPSTSVDDVVYTPHAGASAIASIYDKSGATDTGDTLKVAKALTIPGYFLPPSQSGGTSFTMTATYDVLDKTGAVVREGATATNTFTIASSMERGEKHVINVLVKPTYLYQLSDNDLNNPELTFN